MTIQALINTLDEFRDEYNTSTDKEIKKLCGFITNSIQGLQAYQAFFSNTKSRIESSQQFYSDTLDSINKLLVEENPGDTTSGEDTTPGGDTTLDTPEDTTPDDAES